MSIRFKNIKVGDTISAKSWCGEVRKGVVDEVSDNIKNGRPGCGYGEYWCYADQIISHTAA